MKRKDIEQFQHYILNWYTIYGRTHLPWRQTNEPYNILVSELMLQQTQVERVIPKYTAFLDKFPSVKTLAEAPLSEVLTLWQGLGYNRRAKFLHQAAKYVDNKLEGIFPTTFEQLTSLPGIGPYTAAAITTFAFNKPIPVIETNIRAVYIYHFFAKDEKISDADLIPLIKASIYQKNPKIWYSALMDYGSVLKKTMPNPSRKSKNHTVQSTFSTSPRKVRGEIIRYLTTYNQGSFKDIEATITGNKIYYSSAIHDLEKEGLIIRNGEMIKLGE